MTTQKYVLARSGGQQHLVQGDFGTLKTGTKFSRDSLFWAGEWEIAKVFAPDEQNDLEALERLIGFKRLSELFRI